MQAFFGEAASLEGACGAIVELAFDAAIEGRPILLTEEGRLVAAKAALTVPRPVFDIWPADQAMALLDAKSRPALCQHVSAKNRTKLVHWGLIEEFSKSDLLERLRSNHLPKPATWRHLLNLWLYIAPDVTGWQCHDADTLRIVPVQGKDRTLRGIGKGVLFDENGGLEELLPEAARKTQLLHGDYVASFKSCTREDWLRWVSSGRSGLQTMAPLVQKRQSLYGRQQLTSEVQARGARSALYYPYVTNQFVVEDWDFPADYWRHWEGLAKTDAGIWAKIVGKILDQRDTYWSRAVNARFSQVATTGSTRSVSSDRLLTDWLLKLRAKPCLPDTRNMIQLPADLVRRTPETEALIDVEPFVHGLLDRETTRPLLDLLGVRNTPSGPGRLLDRLRALAKSDKAPAHEVEKWYRRLDQMLDGCSTVDAQNIRTAFKGEKLILAQDGTWVTSGGIFLAGDEEDVPGAAVVRASVLDLSLWHRVGVADRPSADLALQWLGTLASGKALSADDARRVRTLLVRYPTRIWEECGHWLNLVGEWAPIESLAYGLSMQTLFRWSHLHEWVKRKTADFQRLSGEVVQAPPFSALPALSDLVEERFNQPSLLTGMEDRRAWLTAFGTQLGRIELADAAETVRVRALAEAIAATSWVQTPKLEVVPYLDGVPAGTARLTDILWLEGKLFVSPLSKAKLARRVPEEIGRNLSADIRAALAYAFERSPADIREYLEENFILGPEHMVVAAMAQPVTEPDDDDGIDGVAEEADKSAQIEAALVDVTVDAELGKYVNGLADRGHFDAVQVAPATSAEVPDEAGGVRAVVLGVKHPHNGRDGSDALVEAKDILMQRGSTPRVYRNMLVFIAAEARQLDHLKDAVRASLAWGEIVRDTERLNLTQSDSALAKTKLAEANETMKTRMKEAWCYLHYPAQESAQADWEWVSGKIPAQDGLLARASKKLAAEEGLLTELGPSRLDRDLQKYIWNDKPHLALKDLREYLNRYIYLPRLRGQDVLVKAVQSAVSGMLPGPFAYAERWDERSDTYLGLAIERAVNAVVVIDSDSIIVKPAVAEAHRPVPISSVPAGTPTGPSDGSQPLGSPPAGDGPTAPPVERKPTRFTGAVMISAERPARDIHQIVEAIVEQLTTLPGSEVKLRLEIDAEVPSGLDRAKVRTLIENANTLGFTEKSVE